MHMKNKCLLQLMRSAFFFSPGLCSEVHVKNKRRGIKLNIFYVTNVELVLPKYNSGNTRAGGCSTCRLGYSGTSY